MLTGVAALMPLVLVYCAVKAVADLRAGRTLWGVIGTVATFVVLIVIVWLGWFALMINSMIAGPE